MEATDRLTIEQVTVETVDEDAEMGSAETSECAAEETESILGVSEQGNGGGDFSGAERGHSVRIVWGSEEELSFQEEDSSEVASTIMGSGCGGSKMELREHFPHDSSTE